RRQVLPDVRPGDQQGGPAPGGGPPVDGVPLQPRGPEPLPEGLRPAGAHARHAGGRHHRQGGGRGAAPGRGRADLPDHRAARQGQGEAGRRLGRRDLRMRRRSTGWLGTLPLLVFYAFVFGIPLAALLVGAFTSRGEPTLANMRQSLEGGNLTAMAGSVQVSAVVALLGAVLGTVFAYAVVTSRSTALRNAVLTASGVLANFGGVPLAFFWVATLGNSGVVSGLLGLPSGSLYSFWGLVIVYLYFSVPLMVLVMAPALDGLRPQWREAAANSGATAWH